MHSNTITRLSTHTTPLCFMPDGTLVCYKYGDVVLQRDGIEIKHLPLFKAKKEKWLGRNKLAYRLLRLGIRTAIAIDEENIILSVGNMLYEFNLLTGERSNGFFCGNGIRPLIFTTVNGIEGFDNGVYFGGYTLNMDKNPIHIYHRVGVDNWKIVYTFPQDVINHIHNIVPDYYRKCIWIFTGDFDESSAIWKAEKGYKDVERVVCNDQKYRGCVAFAVSDGLLYATDAPYADNYIYLMNTETYDVKGLIPIDGSCIYGCQWKDKYVFSSTVEGDGRNLGRLEFLFSKKLGAGIKDNYVHLYCGNLTEGFKEVYKEEKDSMPLYTFQYGVFGFPSGTNNTDTLYFQPKATINNDLNLMGFSEE